MLRLVFLAVVVLSFNDNSTLFENTSSNTLNVDVVIVGCGGVLWLKRDHACSMCRRCLHLYFNPSVKHGIVSVRFTGRWVA